MVSKINSILNNLDIKETYFQFFDVTVVIKSNSKNILSQVEDMYNFFKKDKISVPSLEFIVLAKNEDLSEIKNIKMYVITPDTFDGWRQAFKAWCNNVRAEKILHEFKKGPSFLKVKSPERKVYQIKLLNVAGWLQHIHYFLQLYVFGSLKQFYRLHGGGLEWKNKGIILTGSSGSGKSILTYALVLAGFRFFTDETVLINPSTNQMLPFPICPSFAEDGKNVFDEIFKSYFSEKKYKYLRTRKYFLTIPIENVGDNNKPVTPNFLIFPKYKPDQKPEIKEISSMQAQEKLLQEKGIRSPLIFEDQMAEGKKFAENFTRNVRCYELISNDLDKTIALVKSLF